MDTLCRLLADTHLKDEVSIESLIQTMNQLNINNDDVNDLAGAFAKLNVGNVDVINIIKKSNNLHEFCYLMLNIIRQRGNQRCYKMDLVAGPVIY